MILTFVALCIWVVRSSQHPVIGGMYVLIIYPREIKAVTENLLFAINQEKQVELLSAHLFDLRIHGDWSMENEIVHYFNGFVGAIEWMLADALLHPQGFEGRPIHEYCTELKGFLSLLRDTKRETESLPPHRRPVSQALLTADEICKFDEYISLRDECAERIKKMSMRMRALYKRENQEWNLLVEHIGAMIGYPGLIQRDSTLYPDLWPVLERVQQNAMSLKEMKQGDSVLKWIDTEEHAHDSEHRQFVSEFPQKLLKFMKKHKL